MMEFQLSYLKILKDDAAVKVLHSICQQIWKTQQWPQDWKKSVFFPIPKKGNAKECSKLYDWYLQFSEEIFSLSHSIVSSVSLHCSLREAFLSLLANLWNSAFSWYIFPFLLCLSLLFFSLLFVRLSQTTILSFCISFSWEWS